jgi:hypothetical protein
MNVPARAQHHSSELARIDQLPAVTGGETAASASAAQAKALVEARYTVALHRPRDIDQVRERLMKECKRPSFAAVARYRKPIGQGIEGPSIRFAEAAIRCMTNITVDTQTIYDDREKRIVRVSVTDLEANVPYAIDVTIEKTVERRKTKQGDVVLRSRLNSYGDTVYIIEATEDDILNKQNALISKAIRTQGLRLIPGDLIDEAMWLVKETMNNADAADPDAARRRLFDSFGEVGVRIDELKKYLGHDAATLTPKELSELRALYAALRDGETNWREVMDAREGGAAGESESKSPGRRGRPKLADAMGTSRNEAASEEGPVLTTQEVHDALATATTRDALDEAGALIDLTPETGRGALHALLGSREKELAA